MGYQQAGQTVMDRTPEAVIGQIARTETYVRFAESLGVKVDVNHVLAIVANEGSSPNAGLRPPPPVDRMVEPETDETAQNPRAGRRGRRPGARRMAGKDPVRVAAGKRAWATRQGKSGATVAAKKATARRPVGRPRNDPTAGMTSGQRAFHTRITNIMNEKGVTEQEARTMAMGATAAGRTRKAEERRAAEEKNTRQTRNANRRVQSGRGRRGGRQAAAATG